MARRTPNYCRHCGSMLSPGAKFCTVCGAATEESGVRAASVPPSSPESRPDSGQGSSRTVSAAVAAAGGGAAALLQNGGRIAAASAAGAVELGEFGGILKGPADAAAKLRAETAQALSPIRALLGGVKTFFGGLASAIRNPKALLPVLLLAAAWIVLPLLQRSGSGGAAVRLLSFLTFAGGGAEREGLGLLGDIAGKGTVAAALASLFSGGLRSAARGGKAVFSRGGEKRGLLPTLLGAAIAAALGLFCSGLGTGGSAMAGLSGALLHLEALGRKDGFLYTLAAALTARKENGLRCRQDGPLTGLLGGAAAGYAAAAALSALF